VRKQRAGQQPERVVRINWVAGTASKCTFLLGVDWGEEARKEVSILSRGGGVLWVRWSWFEQRGRRWSSFPIYAAKSWPCLRAQLTYTATFNRVASRQENK